MLSRAFRLTDKFTNAFLRLLIWMGETLLTYTYRLRVALVSSAATLWFTVTQTARSGRVVYESSAERRRSIMARRAVEISTNKVLREDPLKTQNRALSVFTVVLMLSLIGLVLWFTSYTPSSKAPVAVAVGTFKVETKAPPTPTPTLQPTATQGINPLVAGGTVVYSLRQNGYDSLWAYGIGGTDKPIRLTNGKYDDRDPAWSPDGRRIAFASRRDGNWQIYVLDVASGGLKRLTLSPGYKAAPTWSPDSQFIAYEGYEGNNLDIYVIASDGSQQPQQITKDSSPDFAPAWDPKSGRKIAFVSLRDGNANIYIADLDHLSDANTIKFTDTPDIDEDLPAWSPDGLTIAYTARVDGKDIVYTKPAAQPNADAVAIGQGNQPAWGSDSKNLLYFAVADNGASSTILGGQLGGGVGALALTIQGKIKHLSWNSAVTMPASFLTASQSNSATQTLFVERPRARNSQPPYYGFAPLNNVKGLQYPFLADRVMDSFDALRQAVNQQSGYDFFGSLQDALWNLDRIPDPGQTRQSWHYAGRAIAFNKDLVYNNPAPIEVVREDSGVNTYWRVYLRVADNAQSGQLGEPLKSLPWDFASRTSGDPQVFEQGGRPKPTVPNGYYIDLTQLAEDYGWQPIASERTWRRNFSSLLYWEFIKGDNLSWNDAMLELYTQKAIDAFMNGPTPLPTQRPTITDTPGPRRTQTPIPPDQKP